MIYRMAAVLVFEALPLEGAANALRFPFERPEPALAECNRATEGGSDCDPAPMLPKHLAE